MANDDTIKRMKAALNAHKRNGGYAGTIGDDGTLGNQGSLGGKGDTLSREVVYDAPRGKVGAEGKAGKDGASGKDGRDGRDGKDAVGIAGRDGMDGRDGLNGSRMLGGKGLPHASFGSDGDTYIDVQNSLIYGPKFRGHWGNPTSITGAMGPRGERGQDGLDGVGGGSAIEVVDETNSLTTALSKFTFTGAGVTATEPAAEGEIVVTVPGGAGVDWEVTGSEQIHVDRLEASSADLFRDKPAGEPILIVSTGQSNPQGLETAGTPFTKPTNVFDFGTVVGATGAQSTNMNDFSFTNPDPAAALVTDPVGHGSVGYIGYMRGNTGNQAITCAIALQEATGRDVYVMNIHQGSGPIALWEAGASGYVRILLETAVPWVLANVAALSALNGPDIVMWGQSEQNAFVGGFTYIAPLDYKDDWIAVQESGYIEDFPSTGWRRADTPTFLTEPTQAWNWGPGHAAPWRWEGLNAVNRYTDDRTKLVSSVGIDTNAGANDIHYTGDGNNAYGQAIADVILGRVEAVSPASMELQREKLPILGGDLDAGGYSITNAVAVTASGFAGSGAFLTNTIGYSLKSATTAVVVSAATAPTNGQVLTASSSTAASWAVPDHDALTNYEAAEHIDWAVTGGEVIHADRYTDTDTTYVSSDFDHDALTNVKAAEHVEWAVTGGETVHVDRLTGTAASLTAGEATTANALESATTTVVVSAATAPTNGQVLTASSGTAASWVSPSGGSDTPWTVDHDAAGYNLDDVGTITFEYPTTYTADTPDPIMLNDSTSENTQTAASLGYGFPTTLSEQSTYTVSKGNIFGMGAVFENKVTGIIKGTHVAGAGAYFTLLDQSNMQSVTAARTLLNVTGVYVNNHMWSGPGATSGTGADSGAVLTVASATGYDYSPNIGEYTVVTKARGYAVGQPVVESGGTLTTFAGFDCQEQDVATNTVGYSYGDTVATSGNWAFNSASSTHPSRFGGGIVNRITTYSSGAQTLDTEHSYVVFKSTATCVLPAVSAVYTGQTYNIVNDTGGILTVTSASTITGDVTVPDGKIYHAISDGTEWYLNG